MISVTSLGSGSVVADTTDVTWRDVVTVAKEGSHCVNDPNCFNRYHPAIPSVMNAKPVMPSFFIQEMHWMPI